uniref:Helix-turn-helix domain-containing protein n=1 Tax=Nothobranchius pienaari TaxID=704102 RepID=A0A1A8PCG2_9TELE
METLTVPESSFLFTMDVESLYTNIETDKGMAAIQKAFQDHPDPKRPDKEVLELLHINLTCNDFNFNEHTFLQIKDSHALLHKHSFHPPHTFRGIVRAQLLRFRRICSRADDFHEATGTLFAVLRKRGYSRSFLRRILKDLNTQPRTSDQSPIVPLTSFFSSHAKRAHHTIKMNFQTVMANTRISDHKVISAYMKNPNLKGILVKAKLNSKTTPSHNQPVIKGYKSKTGFCTQKGLNHTSRNCVYCIQCKKCNQHVGETGNTLRTRLYGHIHNIRHARGPETALVRHFRAHGLTNLTISPLESRVGWSTGQRRHAEQQWIKRLNCHVPKVLFGMKKW